MWNVLALTTMLSLVGYYNLSEYRILPNPDRVAARNLAASMGTYRQAVINYSTANPTDTGHSVDPAAFFPTGYTVAAASIWSNYIEPDGTIYIYPNPAKPLPVNITAEIVSLSQNSVLAGESGATDNMLHAPADIATPIDHINNNQDIPMAEDYHVTSLIPLTPSTSTLIVPPGSPVWLAYKN
ncbi:type IV pilus biogenesis protein PilM [Undibacterium sp. SXout7W]|uniref:type IV pilus biogenesis protein PilM n=1 Tax=Undibacterium sp. SXout7W TaxID=3413049 RepID=UPI003BF403CC